MEVTSFQVTSQREPFDFLNFKISNNKKDSKNKKPKETIKSIMVRLSFFIKPDGC